MREFLAAEGAGPLTVADEASDALLAERVAARENHFNVVAAVGAASASHFRLPHLEFETGDF